LPPQKRHTCRSYVGRIPKETTEEDIAQMFAEVKLECSNIIVTPPPPPLPPSMQLLLPQHVAMCRPPCSTLWVTVNIHRSCGIKTPKTQRTRL
jgi:RNA recognition motif-containing protein